MPGTALSAATTDPFLKRLFLMFRQPAEARTSCASNVKHSKDAAARLEPEISATYRCLSFQTASMFDAPDADLWHRTLTNGGASAHSRCGSGRCWASSSAGFRASRGQGIQGCLPPLLLSVSAARTRISVILRSFTRARTKGEPNLRRPGMRTLADYYCRPHPKPGQSWTWSEDDNGTQALPCSR